jgi:hypothetical protein
MADNFFSAYLAVKMCISPEQRTNRSNVINTEALMGMWMVRHALRYDVQNWFWLLVRDDTGKPDPECKRVVYIGAKSEIRRDLMRRCETYKKIGVLSH